MKKPKRFIIGFTVFILAGGLFFKPLALSLIKRQLKSAFRADSVSIRDFTITPSGRLVFSGIEIKQKPAYDIRISELKLSYNPFRQRLNSLDLKLVSLDYLGWHLAGGILTAAQGSVKGNLYLREISYDKLKIEELRSSVGLEGKSCSLVPLSAKILGGRLEGQLALQWSQEPQYRLDLKFIEMDLARFITDFNLQKRLELTGRLSGDAFLQGNPARISSLSGDFHVLSPGGTLSIRDPAVLEYLSRMTGQSLKVLVEGFQDYQYNIGTMTLSLDNNDLVWKMGLSGEKGNRDLTVAWHDFQSKKEGQ